MEPLEKPNIKELKRRNDVEGLIIALGDEKEYMRRWAADALGKIGDARAVKPLMTALGDEDRYVRMGAADALSLIGDERAVEPLINVLRDEDADVRWSAIRVLGEIGDTRAVPVLKKATNDSCERVGNAATEALDKIKSSDAHNRRLKKSHKEIHAYIPSTESEIAELKSAGVKIQETAALLKQAKKFGINTKVEEEKLNNAKLKLGEKDFSNVTKLSKECKGSLNERINEYKKVAERSATRSLYLVSVTLPFNP